MPYITTAELAERPGARELAQVASAEHLAVTDYALMDATLRGTDRSAWTLAQLDAADAALARVEDAVAEASALIDGYLVQGGYTLPLDLGASASSKNVLTAWARAMARYLLNQHRITDETKDPVARDNRDAHRMLALVAQGKFSLGVADPAASAAAGSATDVRFAGAAPVFGRSQLNAFR